MSRIVLAITAAGLLALFGVVLLAPQPSGADEIAAGLRCPDCQSLSVADSRTPSAIEIRRQIDALIAEGRSPDEVRQHFVDRYGEWILLAPRSMLVWSLPFAAVLLGIGALLAWLLCGRPQFDPRSPVTAGERQRIRDEVEALDA